MSTIMGQIVFAFICLCLFIAITSVQAVLFPKMVVVIHTKEFNQSLVLHESLKTWLKDIQVVVVHGNDFYDHNRKLLKIQYNGNPGCANCPDPTYLRREKYFGAHRSIAGALIAFDTFQADWIYVLEDDNFVDLNSIYKALLLVNSEIPLLLANMIAPSKVACQESSSAAHWSCCTDLSKPCLAMPAGPPPSQAVFSFDATKNSLVVERVCNSEVSTECCATTGWPEGVNYGYPFRVSPNGTHRPHFADMRPVGTGSFALSYALIRAVGRDAWQKCVYAIQCGNADERIMTCVLNAGFSVSHFPAMSPFVFHNIRSVEDLHAHISKYGSPS